MTRVVKSIRFLLIFFALFMGFMGKTFGLEELSIREMRTSVAQAGISIAISEVVTETYTSHVTVYNTDDEAQYVTLTNIHILSQVFSGITDVNGDLWITPMKIDIGNYNDMAMVHLENLDLAMTLDVTIDAIDFCGTDIGSLSVASLFFSGYDLYLGPHAGDSGISFQYSQQVTIGSVSYSYNSTESLTLSNVKLAGSFSGTLEDPSTWTAGGSFQIGDLENDNPASLDIAADSVEYWTFTDSNGSDYTVSNPRYNTGYIALNLPLSGSFRIESISFGESSGTDLGIFALDGINVETLYIEIPGRGLGTP